MMHRICSGARWGGDGRLGDPDTRGVALVKQSQMIVASDLPFVQGPEYPGWRPVGRRFREDTTGRGFYDYGR